MHLKERCSDGSVRDFEAGQCYEVPSTEYLAGRWHGGVKKTEGQQEFTGSIGMDTLLMQKIQWQAL